ncbi:MAG: DUF6088 family protein [Peptostreptococcaceae bacterium]|nr:DUF6088 family protein [Peptostreptococcaceae bacterium]
MNNYSKQIEAIIEQEPENKLLDASALYKKLFGAIPETSYYKTLERLSKRGALVHLTKGLYYRPKKSRFGFVPISEREILAHYTKEGQGIMIGYRLYNQKGLTTQISKTVEVLSSVISEQKKNIQNICVKNSGITLTEQTIPVIETLEILQNYKNIEDINKSALAEYMKKFSLNYTDSIAIDVLKNRKYKKSTIALLENFLLYHGIENTLYQFLSPLSSYAIPEMEEFYETA